jgi:predicted phage baseplate assembly protein
MSLVPPRLDDRRFDDLRTEALQRVRLSCPEWTDFNVSDPGVTLIELFAWFTELMLFRMNQVPDKLHGELLSLVGVQPEPAKPAQALIEFIPPDENCPRIVPRLVESVSIDAGGDRPLKFQTQRDLAMIRAPLTAIARKLPGQADGDDLTKLNDLPDRGFDPFGPTGAPASELRLFFAAKKREDLPGDLFPNVMTFHVTTMNRTANSNYSVPQDTPFEVKPQAPPLCWEARMEGDVWEPLEILEDESKSFERDGFIRIAGPRRAVPFQRPGRQNQPQYAFELRCRVAGAGFAFGRAARFRRLAYNAVMAAALSTESEDFVGTSTGLQGQLFGLRNRPVVRESLRLVTRISETDDRRLDVEWLEVPDFSESLPTDQHFVLDAASGQISFGDGKRGQIPRAGRRVVAASYQAGGGALGNVNARKITFQYLGANGTNAFPAINGSDAEVMEGLRQRAAARLRSRDRAVTAADFEELAVRKGQIARAKAIAGLNPDLPELVGRMPGSVTVFVVSNPRMEGNAPPWASDAEIDYVKKVLDECRMVGLELFVQAARIVPVKVTVVASAVAGYNAEDVRQAVRGALNRWLNSKDRGFNTSVYGGDLWSCAAQATIGSARVIDQVKSLKVDLDGSIIEIREEQAGQGSLMTASFVASEPKERSTGVVKIPAHAVLWGRPDHVVDLVGDAP